MYERGAREPELEVLEAIADYFNVNMDTLTGRAEKSPPPGETGSGPEAPEGYVDLADDHKKFVNELIQFLLTKQ